MDGILTWPATATATDRPEFESQARLETHARAELQIDARCKHVDIARDRLLLDAAPRSVAGGFLAGCLPALQSGSGMRSNRQSGVLAAGSQQRTPANMTGTARAWRQI